METISKIEKIVKYIGIVGCIVAGGALLFNFGLIVFDVIRRFVFHNAIRGSTEYVNLAETILIFFGMAFTQHKKGMVHVTFFMKMLPKLGPLISWTIVNWFGTFVGILLTYAAFIHADFVQTLHSATATLYIPLYPFYYLMGFGLALFAIQLFFDSFKTTVAIFNPKVREQVIADWPA